MGLVSLFYEAVTGFWSKRVSFLQSNCRISPVRVRERQAHAEGVDPDKEGKVVTSGGNTWQLCLYWWCKMKQICSPINDLLRGAHAGINSEGAAQFRGDQKKALCFCAARAMSIVNSGPGSRVPTSGDRSQHLNWSKWHQKKSSPS